MKNSEKKEIRIIVTKRTIVFQKSFVALLAVVAVVAADVSHVVRNPDADAQVLKQVADVAPDGYNYLYETSNGIQAQEQGALKNAGTVSSVYL